MKNAMIFINKYINCKVCRNNTQRSLKKVTTYHYLRAWRFTLRTLWLIIIFSEIPEFLDIKININLFLPGFVLHYEPGMLKRFNLSKETIFIVDPGKDT